MYIGNCRVSIYTPTIKILGKTRGVWSSNGDFPIIYRVLTTDSRYFTNAKIEFKQQD